MNSANISTYKDSSICKEEWIVKYTTKYGKFKIVYKGGDDVAIYYSEDDFLTVPRYVLEKFMSSIQDD